MTLRVLCVAEFDPCGVHLRHRKYLRQCGIDYRLAVHEIYWREGVHADWWLRRRTYDRAANRWDWARNESLGDSDMEDLAAFAEIADVVQFCPAIGQPWSCSPGAPRFERDADQRPYGPIDWRELRISGRRVAYFHGSRNAQDHMAAYADAYRQRGFGILASTLDYVHGMQATYAPPIVDMLEWEPAPLRQPGERLRISHAPTDPQNCSTEQFLDHLKVIPGLTISVVMGVEHNICLVLKRRTHVGLDHLRGSFSINSIENAALGLVNLVAVKPEWREWLASRDVPLPWPAVETVEDVVEWVTRLRDDADLTQRLQRDARQWFETHWAPMKVARRVETVYSELARE